MKSNIRTKSDEANFYNQYANILKKRSQLLSATMNERSKQRGIDRITIPQDDRTLEEKLRDINALHADALKALLTITDGQNANKILHNIRNSGDENLVFLAQHINDIIRKVAQFYKYGITDTQFDEFFRKYIDEFNKTQGVDFGSNNSGQLDRIENEMRRIGGNTEGMMVDLLSIMESITEVQGLNAELSRQINDIKNDIKRLYSDVDDKLKSIDDKLGSLDETVRNEVMRELSKISSLDSLAEQIKNILVGLEEGNITSVLSELEEIKNKLGNIDSQIGNINENIGLEVKTTSIKSFNELINIIQPQLENESDEGYDIRIRHFTRYLTNIINVLNKHYDKIPLIQGIPSGNNDESLRNDLNSVRNSATNLGSSEKEKNYARFFRTLQQGGEISFMQENNKISDIILNPVNGKGKDFMNLYNILKENQQKSSNSVVYKKKYEIDNVIRELNTDIYNFSREESKTGEEGEPEPEPAPVGTGLNMTRRRKKRGDQIDNDDIDFTRGIKVENKRFVPFGKYVINKNRLINDRVLSIRTIKGSSVGIKPLRISPQMIKVVNSMIDNKFDDKLYSSLKDDEKEYLYTVSKKSNLLDKFNINSPDKQKEEELFNKFKVVEGQFVAGNNNPQLIKEYKLLLLKMKRFKLMEPDEVNEILEELALSGF